MTSSTYSIMNCIDFDGYSMPPEFADIKEEINNLEVRDDDVWVTSYPKSGTTWCQEMVYLLATNLDYESAKANLDERFPWLENDSAIDGSIRFLRQHNFSPVLETLLRKRNIIENFKRNPEKRFFKSHLPFYLLPKQIRNGEKLPKIIHVVRNPKQVATSFYFFAITVWPIFNGNLNDFVDLYIQGKTPAGYYFSTVSSYLNEKDRPNLLILSYEDMCKDLYGTLEKVTRFLGKSYSEEQLKKLQHHLSFEEMKNNNFVTREMIINGNAVSFMRKGQVDSYKEELTPKLSKKLDLWICDNIKGMGLPYEY